MGIKGIYHSIIKAIYYKPTANSILIGERWKFLINKASTILLTPLHFFFHTHTLYFIFTRDRLTPSIVHGCPQHKQQWLQYGISWNQWHGFKYIFTISGLFPSINRAGILGLFVSLIVCFGFIWSASRGDNNFDLQKQFYMILIVHSKVFPKKSITEIILL